MSRREQIEDFLSQKRLAIVGVSRNPNDFSRKLFRDLTTRGYDIVPVNPNTEVIDGSRCYAHVSDIPDKVDGVIVMTPAKESPAIAADCVRADVHRVWFHRATGSGAVNAEAVKACEEAGIATVPGECPYMFLKGSGFPHNVHRWIRNAFVAETH